MHFYKDAYHSRARVHQRRYRERNTDKIAAYERSYYEKNKDKLNAYQRIYHERNKDKIAIRARNYRSSHMAQARVRDQNRRARKRLGAGSASPDIISRLLCLQRGKCVCCRRKLAAGNHLDHVIPLALGGPHTDDNLQLLCPNCNRKKRAKDPIKFMQEIGYLL